MQVAAFAQKLSGSRKDKVVIGSRRLDSTLALLVAPDMDFLSFNRKNIYAFTLPDSAYQPHEEECSRPCEA